MKGPSDARTVALGTPAGLLAFGFGIGLSPKAPGTAGTVLGMLLAIPLIGMPLWAGALAVAAAFVAGIFICERASRALGVHDHGGIVFDEFVGIWLVLLFAPDHWLGWLAAFLAFRLFDIAKPWPIGWLDRRVQGGFGIMVDDCIAGVYAVGVVVIGGGLIGGGLIGRFFGS
jgi:phosphatidylglycerophosphatase A